MSFSSSAAFESTFLHIEGKPLVLSYINTPYSATWKLKFVVVGDGVHAKFNKASRSQCQEDFIFLGHLDISGVILNDRGQNTNLVARQENKPTIIQVFLCMIKRKKFYDLKI